tara:strand:+ start:375 stop:1457 length:1083 start_codon:yes stop_codon:yes gene_type:complete
MPKYFILKFRRYTFIVLITIIFSVILLSKSFSEENVFVIDNIKVKGEIDINFSRDKYINKAFLKSFEILMSRILLSKDSNKISDISLNKIKNLIKSFQIYEETYRKNEYKASFKIYYSEAKVKKFLGQKNISFSQQKNISVVFFPLFFVNDEIQDFYENFFYKKWIDIEITNEQINFILPVEDLDDISKIKEAKNRIEDLNINDFVNKYDTKNFIFALINFQNKRLNIHLKTNFDESKTSKNISYELDHINNETELYSILKDLKTQITEIWKEENLINLSVPLSIRIKFRYTKLQDLDKLKNIFYNINFINNFSLEELDIKNSFFKIDYYGNPKRLKTELLKFDYRLKNDQGYWEIYTDE